MNHLSDFFVVSKFPPIHGNRQFAKGPPFTISPDSRKPTICKGSPLYNFTRLTEIKICKGSPLYNFIRFTEVNNLQRVPPLQFHPIHGNHQFAKGPPFIISLDSQKSTICKGSPLYNFTRFTQINNLQRVPPLQFRPIQGLVRILISKNIFSTFNTRGDPMEISDFRLQNDKIRGDPMISSEPVK